MHIIIVDVWVEKKEEEEGKVEKKKEEREGGTERYEEKERGEGRRNK